MPAASHLDLILYSRDQLVAEYRAMPTKSAAAEVCGFAPLVQLFTCGTVHAKAQALPAACLQLGHSFLAACQGAPPSKLSYLRPRRPTTPSPWQDPERLLPDVPWGIISVKAQNEDYETPVGAAAVQFQVLKL